MTAVEILGRLNDLGVSVRVNGNKVRVAPVSAVQGNYWPKPRHTSKS